MDQTLSACIPKAVPHESILKMTSKHMRMHLEVLVSARYNIQTYHSNRDCATCVVFVALTCIQSAFYT